MKENVIIQDDKNQQEKDEKIAIMFKELENVEDTEERMKIIKKYFPNEQFILDDSAIINGLQKLHEEEK